VLFGSPGPQDPVSWALPAALRKPYPSSSWHVTWNAWTDSGCLDGQVDECMHERIEGRAEVQM
jgi:hypothetical protein